MVHCKSLPNNCNVYSGMGFSDSSVGKESTCNAGGSIPGSGRLAGEGIGYPLQYTWASLAVQLVKIRLSASLVAQMVKNLPAIQETHV